MSEVPSNIRKEDLVRAIDQIREHGVPTGAQSSTYDVVYEGERFPPKLVVSIANRFANREELDRQAFRGGLGTPAFELLEREGFIVERKKDAFEAGYATLRQRFLIAMPDFEGFQVDERYLESERYYKDELVKAFQDEALPLASSEEWESFGREVIALFTKPLQGSAGKPQNIVGWRYFDPIRKLSPERLTRFGQAVAALIGKEQIGEADLQDFYRQMHQITGTSDYPAGASSRSLVSFLLTLAHPNRYIFLKTNEIRKTLRYFDSKFRWHNERLTAAELNDTAHLATQVFARLEQDGWQPRDLIDVQGFFWIATYWEDKQVATDVDAPREKEEPELLMQEPLNQILYGPPGTGKTFSTVTKALRILDPKFLSSHATDRKKLKQRYDQLRAGGRIAVVTFHQSFSYEDFVEGIRAATDGKGNIRYFIEDGIFKRACLAAQGRRLATERSSTATTNQAGASLVNAFTPGHVFRSGYTVSGATKDVLRLTKPNGSKLSLDMELIQELSELVSTGAITAEDIQHKRVFDKADTAMEKYIVHGYNNLLPEVINHVLAHSSTAIEPVNEGDGDYVLILDEINRGNIPSIFGELITLIEESKRLGAAEATEVILPYSKKHFSVPGNLYLIGTMNTADRSLVHMDTALRRRFTFESMMPDTQVLSAMGIEEVEGVNVVDLLEVMNQRIELLYDREHTIGHTFFLPLADTPTIACLGSIFSRQILPLLEEYFFEDWSKIRQVLGDDLKNDPNTCFITRMHSEASAQALFGSDVAEDFWSGAYSRNDVALHNPEAYRLIYERDEA